jgi:hypothetical protein
MLYVNTDDIVVSGFMFSVFRICHFYCPHSEKIKEAYEIILQSACVYPSICLHILINFLSFMGPPCCLSVYPP